MRFWTSMKRHSIGIIFLQILALSSSHLLVGCSKEEPTKKEVRGADPSRDDDAISVAKFKNCRFQDQKPVYTFKSTIPSNPILCDEGVPTKVELLTPMALPSGIKFINKEQSLGGVANEKVMLAPYQFWIENAAGYTILNLQITIK